MRMLIRDYEPSDEAALRECVVQLQDAEREIYSKTADGDTIADSYIEYLKEICSADKGKILVAELGGAGRRLLGCSALEQLRRGSRRAV